MSNAIRIALVAEGVTDYHVLFAAIESMLEGRPFNLKLLQPEGSVAFIGDGDAGALGGGWRGVYKWCLQAVLRSGSLRDDPLFLNYDIVILHVDADVAHADPAKDKRFPIPELAGVLPCGKHCASHPKTMDCSITRAAADALRTILLSWVGETEMPRQTVLCTPSKSTDTWVMYALFPADSVMEKCGWECHPKPANRLSQQPIAKRIPKDAKSYGDSKPKLRERWPTVSTSLYEARRFKDAFLMVAAAVR